MCQNRYLDIFYTENSDFYEKVRVTKEGVIKFKENFWAVVNETALCQSS